MWYPALGGYYVGAMGRVSLASHCFSSSFVL